MDALMDRRRSELCDRYEARRTDYPRKAIRRLIEDYASLGMDRGVGISESASLGVQGNGDAAVWSLGVEIEAAVDLDNAVTALLGWEAAEGWMTFPRVRCMQLCLVEGHTIDTARRSAGVEYAKAPALICEGLEYIYQMLRGCDVKTIFLNDDHRKRIVVPRHDAYGLADLWSQARRFIETESGRLQRPRWQALGQSRRGRSGDRGSAGGGRASRLDGGTPGLPVAGLLSRAAKHAHESQSD